VCGSQKKDGKRGEGAKIILFPSGCTFRTTLSLPPSIPPSLPPYLRGNMAQGQIRDEPVRRPPVGEVVAHHIAHPGEIIVREHHGLRGGRGEGREEGREGGRVGDFDLLSLWVKWQPTLASTQVSIS